MESHLCLIVDDEPVVRSYVKQILVREGFETIEAENGTGALRLVQRLGDAVDLIVCDLQMPNGDGLTFAGTVRESFSTLPIILMSGFVEPERLHVTTSFEFLQKPFQPTALLQAISSARNAMKLRKKAGATD